MIEFLDECESTQSEIINKIKSKVANPTYAIVANAQTKGIGSRGNEWESRGGNLYLSFAISQKDLAKDIPNQSMSIYFASLMLEFLRKFGSKIWLKWPNDFYLNSRKIGGVLTNKIGEIYICGIGINLVANPDYSDILDVDISPNFLAIGFLEYLENKITWKQIFSNFVLEFEKSREFSFTNNGEKISLKNARLCDDGSIELNSERIYSLR